MLEVVPLGGLGEFGMNMLALTWGETTIVVDAGVMFPDPELLGVDRIIPDLTYLQQKGRAAALVLTHGHEDHIGAVPHVLPHIDGPVYATQDPVLGRTNFFGAHVSRTARIEPVTPPGCVFVTEAFAARLTLEGAPFTCDYAGQVPAAKGFGLLRMYLLRPQRSWSPATE